MITEVILPKLGQTMESGIIAEWLVQEGQAVKKGEPIFTVESDKAVLEATAPASGILRRVFLPKGQVAPVLSLVAVIAAAGDDISAYEKGGQAAAAAAAPATAPAEVEAEAIAEERATTAGGERIFASPRARRLARLEGVTLERVTGTGPGGRIIEQNVTDYLAQQPKATPTAKELARSLGVDLAQVDAAAGQRITGADVRA
ncbi:MAG: E3 binding domain-containing protein, partial [Anaerolineae bacterium]